MDEFILRNIMVIVSDYVMICVLNRKFNSVLLFYTCLYNILFSVAVNLIMNVLVYFEVISILESFIPSYSRFVLVILFNLTGILAFKLMDKYEIIPKKEIMLNTAKMFNIANITCWFILLIFFGYSINDIGGVYSIIILLSLIILWIMLIYSLKNTVELSLRKENEIISNAVFHNIEEYIKNYKYKEEEIKKIRHDFKNHMSVIGNITQEEKVQAYIKEMNESFNNITDEYVLSSGNIYVDAIIQTKTKEYPNILFDVKLEIEGLSMNPKDLSTLIFNLLDNAFQASLEVNGHVEFKMIYNASRLIIETINDVNEMPNFVSKKGSGHGYGMKIIQDIVRKYNGNIEYSYDNNKLKCIVYLLI
ncbi:MAG: GHKL domain-containing protein [Coprobacillus sp.]